MTNEQIDRGIDCVIASMIPYDEDLTWANVTKLITDVLQAMRNPREKKEPEEKYGIQHETIALIKVAKENNKLMREYLESLI